MAELRELHLKPTKSTPQVDFQTGKLSLSGESFPEDTLGFYTVLLDWINAYLESDYAKDTTNSTIFFCDIDYFNTGSRPFVLLMVSKMNDLYKTGHKIDFTWHYDADEGIEEDDVNFKELLEDFQIPVNYIPKKIGY